MAIEDKQSSTRREATFGAASLIYVAFCVAAGWLISRYGATQFDELAFVDVTLLGLSSLRLIHLVSYDKILEPLRQRLERRRSFLTEFVNCLWCTGMWAAVVVVTLYCLGTWGRFAVLVLAVAGLGSLLQVISRAIARCAADPGS